MVKATLDDIEISLSGTNLAGPWARCLARLLDMLILSFAQALLLAFGLPFISMPVAFVYEAMDQRVIGLVLIATSFPLNSLIMLVFGNSSWQGAFWPKSS